MTDIKPEDLGIHFENEDTTIGKLSKKQMIRLIAGLLMQRQQVINVLIPPKPQPVDK